MTAWIVGLALLLAYLMGSTPFGFLIARMHGVDIRQAGSGNIGATNVFRTIGKGPGVLTFVLDFGKGVVATRGIPALAAWATPRMGSGEVSGDMGLPLLCGAAVFLGHAFPVFLGFKGGKGVATGAGIVVGLAPWAAAGGLAVWVGLFLAGRMVSLASIGAAIAVAVLGWVGYRDGDPPLVLPLLLTVLAVLVVVRHRANILRLLRGEELGFSSRKKGKA